MIYVDGDTFDKMKTKEIADEVSRFNRKMDLIGKEYILVGPGRWGTRDPFTGIPVTWAEICKARIIVEVGLPDFPLDGSLGSHFFHNVTSMNVGYFSIPLKSRDAWLNSQLFDQGKVVEELHYVKHIQFKDDLTILMDGRKREALIHL